MRTMLQDAIRNARIASAEGSARDSLARASDINPLVGQAERVIRMARIASSMHQARTLEQSRQADHGAASLLEVEAAR